MDEYHNWEELPVADVFDLGSDEPTLAPIKERSVDGTTQFGTLAWYTQKLPHGRFHAPSFHESLVWQWFCTRKEAEAARTKIVALDRAGGDGGEFYYAWQDAKQMQPDVTDATGTISS